MSDEREMKRWSSPTGIFLLVSAGAIACALVWSLYVLFLRPPLTMEMVSPGMTVEQVEAIFGKPVWVHPESESQLIPTESRGYTNDDKHYMHVEFRHGRVFHISESTRDTRLIKPG